MAEINKFNSMMEFIKKYRNDEGMITALVDNHKRKKDLNDIKEMLLFKSLLETCNMLCKYIEIYIPKEEW
jgi:hypothetical protein